MANAEEKEKARTEEAAASFGRRKARVISLKNNQMLGRHGIGKIKAGKKIGPGRNNWKNPMQPKEKERKAKEKASGAKMAKVMARITFQMQLQKVPQRKVHQ